MRITDLDAYKSRWLSAGDLNGKPHRVKISEWGLQKVRNQDGSEQQKVRLAFSGARKQLLLNATQAKVLDAAFGELEHWIGGTIILQPTRTGNGVQTIEIVIAAGELPAETKGGTDENPFDDD